MEGGVNDSEAVEGVGGEIDWRRAPHQRVIVNLGLLQVPNPVAVKSGCV